MKDIKELRQEIDLIDKQMKVLFFKRMETAYQIGEYKKANNLPIFDPKREEEIINKIKEDNDIDSSLLPLYIEFVKSIMNISKDYQKTVK